MTNGVFDVLHRGHVSYLLRAAELGASLLVAVNTDQSARMLGKGPERPLNSERDRAYVLAGLSSVDKVTFFDARSPVELIKKIKPEVYVKGGDYDMETLEETGVVRTWGGKSLAIPFLEGFSTTALVQRIRAPLRKAAFLYRDGVIYKDKGYLSNWEDFEFVPDAIEGMHLLQKTGYTLVVVTKQAGLVRDCYTDKHHHALTRKMLGAFNQEGIDLAGVYHCHLYPEAQTTDLGKFLNFSIRGPELNVQAVREMNLSMQDSLFVGDKLSHINSARAIGVAKAYIVALDNLETATEEAKADRHFSSLFSCAQYLAQTNQ